MTFSTTDEFKQLFDALPVSLQKRTRNKLLLWEQNPQHPSLRFKKVSKSQPIWSLRVNVSYRMLGYRQNDQVTWFWIGSHADYEKMLARL